MVHAAADDQATDPTGNSGDRVACGIVTEATTSMPQTGGPDVLLLTAAIAGGAGLLVVLLLRRRVSRS